MSHSCKKRPAESDNTGKELTKRLCKANDDPEEQLRLEAKREYNRINAARARERTKGHITELCIKVRDFEDKNAALETKNESLMSRVVALMDENKVLRSILLETMAREPLRVPGADPTPGYFFPQKDKLTQDYSLVRSARYG
jgi:hypothetical protein